jgi:NAD(P)-dependent dehydrogenase (short-subunit alcohol dehydrogenase family)
VTRPVVLLTGASTGLGLAIARALIARNRHHLVLTARESSLPRFADAGVFPGEHLWLRPLEVTDEEQRHHLIAEIDATLGGVSVLVNNAGISYRSVMEHVTDEEREQQMAINCHGPVALCRAVLPAMRARRSGRIVQISSAGGFMAMPTMGVYAASKFALEGATEAMYYELRPFGVAVHLVLPGFIRSVGIERVVLSGQSATAAEDPADPYHLHYRSMAGFIGRVARLTPATPETVARTVVRVIEGRTRRLRVPGTWDTRLLWTMRRLLPQILYHDILYWLLPSIRAWGRPR